MGANGTKSSRRLIFPILSFKALLPCVSSLPCRCRDSHPWCVPARCSMGSSAGFYTAGQGFHWQNRRCSGRVARGPLQLVARERGIV